MEYFSRDRSDPRVFLDKWDRWVRDDWYRAYVLKLGKLGLERPAGHLRARARAARQGPHPQARDVRRSRRGRSTSGASTRSTSATSSGSRRKYPGWYDEYGFFWEAYRELEDPQRARRCCSSGLLDDAPPFCWTCQMPCVIDEDVCHREVDGRTRFYCSKECRWLDESNPGRYTGDRNFFDRYHGWELSDVVARPRLRARRRQDADRPAAPRGRRAAGRSTTSRACGRRDHEPEHHRRPSAMGLRRDGSLALARPARTAAVSARRPMSPRVLVRADRRGDRLRRGRDRPRRRLPRRATTSSTAAARGSARRASASCSRARSRCSRTRPSRCRRPRRRRATRCCAGRCPTTTSSSSCCTSTPTTTGSTSRSATGRATRRRGRARSRTTSRACVLDGSRSRTTSTSSPASTSTSRCRARDERGARSRWRTSPATGASS